MSEIQVNSTQFVYLDIFGGVADGTPTAACTTPGNVYDPELVVSGPINIPGGQRWTTELGLVHTQEVGSLLVEWDFTMGGVAAHKNDWFDVILPLVEINDVREELDLGTDVTDKDLVVAERKARRIIESYCKQQFAPTKETLVLKGRGDNIIRLPKRIISIDEITNYRTLFPLEGYQIRDDGWTLLRTLMYYYGDELTVTGPIFDPFRVGNYTWPANVEWNVKGTWGWNRVPTNVEQAAMILIEQRLCPETTYRDNYLSVIRSGDWRMDFTPEAHSGTGNVVVDQLLTPYIVVGMAIV